jgi:DNA-binding NarL/FixJ family response regulator
VANDTWARRLTAAAVLLVAAIAGVQSYTHIYHLAATHGAGRLDAALLPLSVDGTVLAMAIVMLRCARSKAATPVLATFGLWLAVAATLAANIDYGVPYGVTGALGSGWPAGAFLICAHVAVTMAKRGHPAKATPAATRGQDKRPRAPATAAKVAELAATGMDDPGIAAALGVSPRTVRRYRPRRAALEVVTS